MLYEFLKKYEKPILLLATKKTLGISEDLPSSSELEKGLPIFYQDLIEVLKKGPTHEVRALGTNDLSKGEAAAHGKESKRLGYTISQVVHGYGALCQAVTEYAQEKNLLISSAEFHELNLCLDIAIAQAVTQFENIGREDTHQEEVFRLGELAHELRNTLTSAILAHQMISKGTVGVGGNTSQVLTRAHERMRDLIDRSLSEVRLESAPKLHLQKIQVVELVSDVEVTSIAEANSRGLTLSVDVDPNLEVNADRQLIVSALANLVQNAIKFTKPKGKIWLRGKKVEDRVILEVEDQCGGLPEGKSEELFQPYTQKGKDKSGVGLGLTISKRAIALNGGTLFVRNLPGKGCIFSITLPQAK
jgi:signal transduction histidine kinase